MTSLKPNNRGQSLLILVVGIALLSITMQTTLGLYAAVARQQAEVQRKVAWVSTRANVSQILSNSLSCLLTVQSAYTSSMSIKVSDNTAFLAIGTVLAPQFKVSDLSLSFIGPPTVVSVITTNNGNSQCSTTGHVSSNQGSNCANSGSGGVVTVTTVMQQAKVTLVAAYPKIKETKKAEFLINILAENGVITGCSN